MIHRLFVFSSLIAASLAFQPHAWGTEDSSPEAPPVGEYYCDYGGSGRGQVFGPGRGFFLMPDGQYRALDDEIGSYTFDPVSRKIDFEGGFFDGHNG